MKSFSVKVEKVCDDNLQQAITYGIEYKKEQEIFGISDITTDRKRLEHLVDLCNELELDVSQLREVVEDFLAQ